MNPERLCVSIPEELRSFSKKPAPATETTNNTSPPRTNFGIKIFKKANGQIDYIAHYSDSGDLIKKSYYDGANIVQIVHYRKNLPYCKEQYDDKKIISKTYSNAEGEITSQIKYFYNRNGSLSSIQKLQNKNIYKVSYGYDDLERINSRFITVNGTAVNEQKYRFDILDRIVEYSDYNQKVKVLQIKNSNELIYYTITDKIGNEIVVLNHFGIDGYTKTELTLNGHTVTIVDKSYVDNIMLKKPYTNEDDLDLIISNLFNEEQEASTCRTKQSDSSSYVIESNIRKRILPISIRKRILYNMSLNAS